MDWYTIIKRYYDSGYYTKANVRTFVEAGKITPAQYQQITGEPYAV